MAEDTKEQARHALLAAWDADLDREERRLTADLELVRGKREAIRRLAQEGRTVISGERLRAAAYAWLVENDPTHEGRHYQEITKALLEQGEVPGRDRQANVRATLHQAKDRFLGLGAGKYTWK